MPYNPDFDRPNDGGRMLYGGYGYHHVLVNMVPRLRQLLGDNPRRAFTFTFA